MTDTTPLKQEFFDQALAYTRQEFEDTSIFGLERDRLLATIERGWRQLPSEGELEQWAKRLLALNGYVSLDINTAMAVAAELGYYPEVKLVMSSDPSGEVVTELYAGIRARGRMHQKLDCFQGAVGIETEAGLNLLRGMWLAEHAPHTARSIREGTSYPSTVAEWWEWTPPQTN